MNVSVKFHPVVVGFFIWQVFLEGGEFGVFWGRGIVVCLIAFSEKECQRKESQKEEIVQKNKNKYCPVWFGFFPLSRVEMGRD